MEDAIKYENLSQEIKKQISLLHEKLGSLKESQTYEESTAAWFKDYFNRWLNERFSSGAGSDSDMRNHYRLNVEIPITVIETLVDGEDCGELGENITGRIVNISRGGLYFRSSVPFNVSSIIKVTIDFSRIDRQLNDVEALAMAVRCDMLPGNYGIGIMFSSIYDTGKRCIDTFILKNISDLIYGE